MIRRQRSRTVVLALAACLALFWGAVDIVGVPARQLGVELVRISLGVGVVIGTAAGAGWLLSRRRKMRQRQ